VGHAGAGQLLQLLIDDRQQPLRRRGIARLGGTQQLRDGLVGFGRHGWESAKKVGATLPVIVGCTAEDGKFNHGRSSVPGPFRAEGTGEPLCKGNLKGIRTPTEETLVSKRAWLRSLRARPKSALPRPFADRNGSVQ
jgi:hypothetical protein